MSVCLSVCLCVVYAYYVCICVYVNAYYIYICDRPCGCGMVVQTRGQVDGDNDGQPQKGAHNLGLHC